jgi:LacI family transcriptional regulator
MAAIGLTAEAHVAGLKVPDDLSVVGYDDIPMATTWVTPTLTTVRQPIAEKGRMAARLLIARLEGEPVKSPPVLRTRLVVRESTAPCVK